MRAPEELVARLAREVLGVVELAIIHREGPAVAAGRINYKGSIGRGWWWTVEGRKVHYGTQVGTVDGTVPLRQITDWAAGYMSQEAGERVATTYSRWAHASNDANPLVRWQKSLPAEQFRELDLAAGQAYREMRAAERAALRPPLVELPGDGGLFPCPDRQSRRLRGRRRPARQLEPAGGAQ